MTTRRMYQRAAYGLALLLALVPTCAVVMAAVGAYRVATRATRRERRLAQSLATVAHATEVAAREASAWADVEQLFNPTPTVHIPAQRRAS